jgi:murein DD-endopeptidase MepM/ murein hydrolase activator NlpD
MLRLTPPTPRAFVSSGWGRPREYRNGWHEGLDFPAAIGTPVLAAAPGEVVRVDNYNDSYAGRWIAIHHGGGMHTRYLHNKENLVSRGDKVVRGQKIATLGQTGTSGRGAAHLHFDVKFQDQAHSAYQSQYGTPTTGWGKTMTIGRGVPGETFMSGATYSDMARQWATERGVVFYSGMAATGTVIGLGLLAGYWAWRRLR